MGFFNFGSRKHLYQERGKKFFFGKCLKKKKKVVKRNELDGGFSSDLISSSAGIPSPLHPDTQMIWDLFLEPRQTSHNCQLTVLGWAGPSPEICPKPCFLFFTLPILGGFPGKSPPHSSINLHQSHQRGLHKKGWQPNEALSVLDPVFLATGSPFLLSINKPQHAPPHPLPLKVQVCFEIHSRGFEVWPHLGKSLNSHYLKRLYPLPSSSHM